MAEMGPNPGGTGPGSRDGRAVLVRSSGADGLAGSDCADLLASEAADGVDLLYVSVSGDPTARFAAFRERGISLDRTAVAAVGAEVDGADPDRSYSAASVQAVDDLSDLGMYVRDVVMDWAGSGSPSVVCFDSVTALTERVDLELTFEFLLVLIEGIRPSGATAYFHFDPDAHDAKTTRTLEHLFDETVGPGGG